MITRLDAALRLDISLQMAKRHGLPPRMTEAELADLEANPPAWLAQSRANRTGKKPVWVELVCTVCGDSEQARPKKWWPTFTHLVCVEHELDEAPDPLPGHQRQEVYGVGSRFTGLVDVPSE